ncbi:(2Fe-2S)-binding protein [Jeotgalicoccus sp. FSL K6-3177]|jgi:hypothetical protein|uniref:(2Fe-2S)-binding protein n=1 Tax=Jeotgalicoccus sp. FSL K6-3177 TaxID=2921494 RepID=UPI0030FDE5F5
MRKEDDFVVCRCENVYYSDLLEIMEDGANNSRELKLKSRAGMGFCNSRTCGPLLEAMTGDNSNELPHYVHLKSQPPIRTISLLDLARGNNDD